MSKELTPMQELHWFVSDGLDNYDESIKVSEIWAKIKELLPKEKQVIEEKIDSAIEEIEKIAYKNDSGDLMVSMNAVRAGFDKVLQH